MSFYRAMPWHDGEDKIHKLVNIPTSDNPTAPGLPSYLGPRLARSPLIALGTTNADGKVWCTLFGGEAPIVQQIASGGVIGVRAQVDKTFDPVVQILYGGKSDGEVIQQSPSQGHLVSGLAIHLEDRDRVKLFGRMLAGSLDGGGAAQLVLQITQSLGNCPKYLNKKRITPHAAEPKLLSDSATLSAEAITHIHNADMFFVASKGPDDMDCNHRGGPPGFLRVESETSIIWPEYSGNNLYQTLGNILHNPAIGLVIPNYTTGDVLYLTGTAEVLVNQEAVKVISKTRLAVRLSITGQKFVANGLSFRGALTEDNRDVSSSTPTVDRKITDGRSPYNPRVRYLVKEDDQLQALPPDEYRKKTGGQGIQATLVDKEKLTPSINRYKFKMSASDGGKLKDTETVWSRGQYVALDFSEELYMGYSHMNDGDPGSLNDDFVRTFTVSKPHEPGTDEFEITVRNVGAITRWLNQQNARSSVNIEVKGFAGDFAVRGNVKSVFIAAGIGITPLLAMGKEDMENLSLVWTLGIRDIGLATSVVSNMSDEFRNNVRLFVTGSDEGVAPEYLKQLSELEARLSVNRRRIEQQDLLRFDEGDPVQNWYLCTGPSMRKQIQGWLGNRSVKFENFDY